MAARDLGAPAFVKEYYFGRIQEALPAKLAEVKASYLEETQLDIPLPTPDFARTKPSSFPAKSKTMVIYTENTAIGDLREPPHGSLEKVDIAPGQAGYESSIRVEYFCRGAQQQGDLRGYEVLNIECQNTLWAAYLVVIDVAEQSPHHGRTAGRADLRQHPRGHFSADRMGHVPFLSYRPLIFYISLG